MTNVDASVEAQGPATQQKTLRGRPVAPSMGRIVLKRLQIKMTERGFRRIEDLKAKTEALSAADVVRDALRVYEAMVDAVSQGKLVILESAEDPSRREVVRLF
jgi:glutamate-1-semialdehyde aminotransferase